MWKFKEFAATQILREIKNYNFDHFIGFGFEFLKSYNFPNIENFQRIKILTFWKGLNSSF